MNYPHVCYYYRDDPNIDYSSNDFDFWVEDNVPVGDYMLIDTHVGRLVEVGVAFKHLEDLSAFKIRFGI